jgi:hypothetical protein
VYGNEVNRALLMSMLPEEYFAKLRGKLALNDGEGMMKQVQRIINQFNSIFATRLDYSIVETLNSDEDNLTTRL